MSTSTFGYNGREDRIWVSSSVWQERIWITRRQAHSMLTTLALTLERVASGDSAQGAQDLAGQAHDAAINHASSTGAGGRPLQVGRDTPRQAAAADYLLCTGLLTVVSPGNIQVQLQTDQGARVAQFDAASMHRWLHAMYLVVRQADWDLQDLPEWLTRSYLPPALRAILDLPLPDLDADSQDDPSPRQP